MGSRHGGNRNRGCLDAVLLVRSMGTTAHVSGLPSSGSQLDDRVRHSGFKSAIQSIFEKLNKL